MKTFTDLLDYKGKSIYSDSVLMVKDDSITEVGNVYFSKGSFMWRENLLSEVNKKSVIIGTSSGCTTDGWFDGLDKFKIKSGKKGAVTECDYPDDCHRIQSVASRLGHELSLSQAQSLWITHSEKSLAGWLYLPKNQKELSKIVSVFLL